MIKKTSLFIFFIICLSFGTCAVPSVADDNDQNSDESNINWGEQAKLLASDRAGYDRFGGSVSLDGNYAIIGAYQDNDNGNYSGSVYVFERTDEGWTQQAKLTASDGAADDYFGCSVSLDGNYAIVGAERDDDNGEWSGSAYVFERTDEGWTQDTKLLPSDGAEDDYFGCSVSLDENYAIIGAERDDDNGHYSGSAYIFKRSGTIWTQQVKLNASDGAADDYFGCSVSLDGEYALIGAYDDYDNGHYSGSAYIFKRSDTIWTQDTKLLPSDGAEYDWFGCSVSLDGEYALIGAYGDDSNGIDAGSAYVFEKNLSVDTNDINGEGDSDSDNDGDTPDFEMLLVILAVAIILIWKRKR